MTNWQLRMTQKDEENGNKSEMIFGSGMKLAKLSNDSTNEYNYCIMRWYSHNLASDQ